MPVPGCLRSFLLLAGAAVRPRLTVERRSEEPLHDGDVEPAPGLAADLPLDAHQLEAARPVQRNRHLVAADDSRHHGMKAVNPGYLDQVGEQKAADAPTPE